MKASIGLIFALLLFSTCSDDNSVAPEDNRRQIVTELYRIFDNDDVATLPDIVSETLVDHDLESDTITGYQNLEGLIIGLNQGFSDIQHQLQEVHLIDDDRIFVRWRMTATHSGEFFGIPASGKRVDFNGHDLFVIREGKISEQWHVEELLSVINQIQP